MNIEPILELIFCGKIITVYILCTHLHVISVTCLHTCVFYKLKAQIDRLDSDLRSISNISAI